MAARAVIFDLDGTLADTGPDLLATLNVFRSERGLPDVTMAQAGHLVGHGSRRLMNEFLVVDGEDMEPLRDRFLSEYEKTEHEQTRLFDGIEEALRGLEDVSIPWAIVTNKPTRQTESLLPVIGLAGRPAQVVCSDTLSRKKPDPDQLLHVCDRLSVDAGACLFVGDNDELDAAAAAACGMPFAAAGWGYWLPEYKADTILDHPSQILRLVGV